MNEKLLKTLVGLSANELAEVLRAAKEQGAKITTRAPKAEKEYVAYRVQTKDTAPNARRPRKAGEVFPMTAKSLENTVKTWVRGKKGQDVEALQNAVLKSVMDGHKESFSSFEIVGATSPDIDRILKAANITA